MAGGMTIDVPLHQKVLSFLRPVSLRQAASETSGFLELLLYRNQFRLLTGGAIYSDGDRYRPAFEVVRRLGEFLPEAKRVLVLGAGLGSLVHVLRRRGYDPTCTLVEKDATVLRWAQETLGEAGAAKLDPVCEDAAAFMARNRHTYDLVFVDVFEGRVVPEFVTAAPFLRQCRDSLAPGGRLALNYIAEDQHRWIDVLAGLAAVFPACEVVNAGTNRILVSSPFAPDAR